MSEQPENERKGFRAPGDRRPPSADLPPAKKVFVRRRPASAKPSPAPAPEPREEYPPRFEMPRQTSHDRYLTYDFKGRLITHTVYHAPPSKKPVTPILGKKKKKQT